MIGATTVSIMFPQHDDDYNSAENDDIHHAKTIMPSDEATVAAKSSNLAVIGTR